LFGEFHAFRLLEEVPLRRRFLTPPPQGIERPEERMFPAALNHCPSCSKSIVWRLNEENVVNPPRMPMVTNARANGETSRGPSGPVSSVKKPITKEPITFTASVPQGNVL
jgi:hypothetical protein